MATTVASLRILLGLDSKDVRDGAGSAKRELQALQKEADRTRRSLVDGFKAGIGIGAGLGAFDLAKNATRSFTDAITDSVRAAIEEEKSIARLGAALQANIPAWDGNIDAIEGVIKTREALAFSDDDLRTSLASLVGATQNVAKAQELQAAAMDLARFRGVDLGTATDALIKVEAGRYRGLIALGIKLKEGATQEDALAAVRKVAAGQAAEYADTTAGAMEAAAIAVDDLKEAIGERLAPKVKDLATSLRTDLIPALSDTGSEIGDFLDRVNHSPQLLGLLTLAIFNNKDALQELADKFGIGKTTISDAAVALRDAREAAVTGGRATKELTSSLDFQESQLRLTGAGFTHYADQTESAVDKLERELKTIYGVMIDDGDAALYLARGLNAAGVEAQIAAAKLAAFKKDHPVNKKLGAGTADAQVQFNVGSTNTTDDAFDPGALFQYNQGLGANFGYIPPDTTGGGASKAADDTSSAIRDAFGRMRDAAHAYFDAVHEGRIREIEDARDTANADIDNQLRSIRERVSAERDRVNGMRAARQEESLRAAVAAAKTPQELARAQQALNDFLDDQRLAFIDRQAAQQEAALNAQKQANTANAAALTQTENERYQAQVKLFDETLGALEKYLSDHPKLWKTWQDKVVGVLKAGNIDYEKAGKENADAYLRGLRKVLSNVNVKAAPSASGSVGTSTSAVATNLAWVGDGKIGDVFLDADKVGEVLGKRNSALIAIYNPTSVSTGAQQ